MERLLRYLNPVSHFGERRYSFLFPLIVMLLTSVVLEFYAFNIAHNSHAVDLYAIFLYIALIIYFSFHDGIVGGIVSVIITIGYYFYIIYSRQYSGQEFTSALVTTFILTILYSFLAGVIGWLRQTIDRLIEEEMDEKIRLQSIVQQLPVGVIISDRHGKVMQANKQIELILGVKIHPGAKVGKETFVEAEQNGKVLQPSQSPLAQTLNSGKPIVGQEFTIHRKDGKDTHIQVNTSVIRNKDGKIIAAASIVNDITQKKEMEDRKDDFVNMASHELKTPITSLKLYIDILLSRIKKTGDEKTMKTLTSIKYQTERLQELVRDLLDVSRLQKGKLAFNREKFRIDLLAEECVNELQGSSKQTIIFSGKSPLLVYADKFRMYQVITNLLTNAIKYSPDAERIEVKTTRQDSKAVVSVKDWGIGIAKKQQKKIFERLYQVTDPNEKTFPGLGMGLYISQEIIKRHKGSLWVDSEKDKGSVFSLSLPLHKKGSS